MRRCYVRVEHNFVVGVDVLVATLPHALVGFCGIVRCSGPDQLYSLRIETGSALDMQLVLHMQLAGVSRSHYSENHLFNGGLEKVNKQLVHQRLCGFA